MIARDEDGKFQTYVWPGGYPVYHLCADYGVLCPKCANGNSEVGTSQDTPKDWRIVASGINWEDPDLYCDHCEQRIESAYAEDLANTGEQL